MSRGQAKKGRSEPWPSVCVCVYVEYYVLEALERGEVVGGVWQEGLDVAFLK